MYGTAKYNNLGEINTISPFRFSKPKEVEQLPTQQLVIYLLVYLVPAFIIFGIGCMVLAQSPRRLEHKLMVAFSFTYCLLYLEEFIRHLLPLSSSVWMVGMFYYQIRLLTSTILFHFFIHTTKMYERYRIPFYPYLFYVPVAIVVMLTLMHVDVVDTPEFIQTGIWYSPIFNETYYMKLIFSIVIIVLMIITLWNGMNHATSFRKRKSIQVLLVGMISMFILTVILGYPNYGRYLPPHPYLLSGIVFSAFLSISVLRFQLLPSVSRRYKEMFNLGPVSIIITNDQWEVLEFNDNAAIELGSQIKEGFVLIDYFRLTVNKQQLLRLSEQLEKEGTIRDYSLKILNTAEDEYLYFSLDASIVRVDEDVFYYLIWRNVTEELESKQLVQHLAYHDALTNIFNRGYFVTEVKERLKSLLVQSTNGTAVVLIDLNRFKVINDTYGHVVGDQVLKHTAFILMKTTRKSDIVARFGGDEFVIFLEEYPSGQAVYDWVEVLRKEFAANPFVGNDLVLEIEPSIGVAFYSIEASQFDELFQLADVRMYEDKKKSRRARRMPQIDPLDIQ